MVFNPHAASQGALLAALGLSAGSAWADPAQRNLSGGLQQQIQNDPVLTPRPQLPLQAPRADRQAAPQTEDDGAEKITVKSFVFSGNQLLSSEELQALLRPWVDIPISLMELRRGVAQVAALYRSRGYLAQGVLPNQDITEGTVQVQVIEGKVGKIVVDAPQGEAQIGAFLRDRIETLMARRTPPGQVLSFDQLDWAVWVADDLPGVSVSASLKPGEDTGTTDLVLRLAPTPKIRGVISADNNGSRSTGPERLNALVQWESALGLGENFNLSASKTQGTEFVRLGHSFPVGVGGWRGLTLSVNTSVFGYRVLNRSKPSGSTFAPQGTSTTQGLSLRYPFVRSGLTTLAGEWGYETRLSQDKGDSLSASQETRLGILRDTRAEVSNLTLSLNHLDNWGGGGSNTLTSTFTQGTVRLQPESVRTDDAAGANTAGAFRKLRLTATRVQALNARHTAVLSVTGQFADRNLDASEKLYLGGSSSVRAFPNSELGGSEGFSASLEWRQDWTPRWQTSYFYDYGRVWQYKKDRRGDDPTQRLLTDVANAQSIDGHGVSLTYRQPNGTEIRAQLARRLRGNPLATQEGKDKDGTLRMERVWISISVPF